MSEEYYAELYDWLTDAYEAALALAQPKLAMEYVTMMRAMETAGVVKIVKQQPVAH